MTRLSEAEKARFRRDGALFPIQVCSPDLMANRLARLETIEAARAGRLPPSLNLKPHLLIPWLWDLVHDPHILDPVEDLLGPDLLCWGSSFFNKSPQSVQHVPWHQDWTYWGLSARDAVTAWIAFTPSRRANGCMRIIPASNHERLRHRDTRDADNMLFGREEAEIPVGDAEAVDIVLEAGEMSLHDLFVVHGSEGNRSEHRRVGFAIRYIAGHLHQVSGERGSATLARGRDHGRFDLELPPECEFHADALRRHRTIFRRWMALVTNELRHSRAASANEIGNVPGHAETSH